MDDLDEEALDTMVNASVSWADHEASSWRHILARNPDDADAEFREEPAPLPGRSQRTVTRRLHAECAALSDRAVEMGRRLDGVA